MLRSGSCSMTVCCNCSLNRGVRLAQAVAGAADRARIVELEAELERAKGREEGLQYALQRAYGCKCMKL